MHAYQVRNVRGLLNLYLSRLSQRRWKIHITPASNVEKILLLGLSPSCSQTRQPRVYLADIWRMNWLCNHIASYKKVPIESLTLLIVDVRGIALKSRPEGGIYYSPYGIERGRIHVLLPLNLVIEGT